MNRFDFQFNYDLNSLGRITQEESASLSEDWYENDIYEFDLSGDRTINLSLHNLSSGDDADLYLYQDSNGNGVLDFSDSEISSSLNSGDSDDVINYQASSGTYFARVQYYDGGSDRHINYDLDLSAIASTTVVDLTENVYLDGILWGGARYLDNTITYSFWNDGSESFDDGFDDEITNDAFSWLDYEIDAVEQALQVWATVANIEFVSVADNDPNATLGFYLVDDAQLEEDLGSFNPPGESGQGIGYFNYQARGWDSSELQPGGYGFVTLLHEIGHGLGLAHPHDDGGGSSLYPGVTDSSDTGDNDLNQGIWTTMSYIDGLVGSIPSSDNYGWQGTPMTFDIAAIQHLYGANHNYASGDNVYQLPTSNSSGSYYSGIWDTGGIDTISGNTATIDVTIDLREAPLTGANAGGYISSVTDINGGFTIANGVTIENAIGGAGNDSIIGNNTNNNLTGAEGDDSLDGGYGNDTLIGSNPNLFDSGSGEYDDLSGGSGADVFVLGDAYEPYYIDSGYATITDFDWTEGDKIRAYGSDSDYALEQDDYNGGIDILYQGDLIGYVSNTNDVLISEDFVFV